MEQHHENYPSLKGKNTIYSAFESAYLEFNILSNAISGFCPLHSYLYDDLRGNLPLKKSQEKAVDQVVSLQRGKTTSHIKPVFYKKEENVLDNLSMKPLEAYNTKSSLQITINGDPIRFFDGLDYLTLFFS